MRGRYPASVEYVDKVEGSALAKERGRAILETMFCGLRWQEACQRVGVRETRLHQLRHEGVQAYIRSMEPGAPGRPSLSTTAEAERIRELEVALAEKELQLQQALVRAEVALILPQTELGKKGQRPSVKLRKRKPR
jgi:hypothetical protein